ncbi:MAG: extracellular solute-binding protein [Bacilli bacterium]|nr:extracellular solute-binding protein [Bacilli bacterium]
MKKVLKMLLPALIAIPLLASCGSKKEQEEPGATVVTMYLRNFEEWSNNYMNSRVSEFNSNMTDGIQLRVKFFEDEAYTDAYKVAKEQGQAPDIFMCSYGNIFNDLVETGDAVQLEGLIKQEYLDDIKDNVKDMMTYRGHLWSYPQLTEPSTLFYYSKSALARANVTVPEDGKLTWDWLYDACAKVKPTLKRAQYCVGIPIGSAAGWATYGMQYNLTNGLAISEDWKQCLVTADSGYKDLCEFWQKLYINGYVPQGAVSPKGSYNDIIEALTMNKLAMTFGGSWSIAEIMHTYPEKASDIGVAVIPTKSGDTSKVTASNGGWTYAISSQSDTAHREAAAKVIEWFFAESAERTAGYFQAAYYSKAAATKSVANYISEHVTPSMKEWVDVIDGVASKAIPEAIYPWSIACAVTNMLETVALNPEAPIINAINACYSSISEIINSPDFPKKPE